jgi:hypothetical protein
MEIVFNTQKLAKLCNNGKEASKKLGSKNDKFLQKRLSQLEDVDQLGDFKFDNPHPLQGGKKEEFAITMYGGCRLTFKAVKPEYSSCNFDWSSVTEINIVYIGDYHE